MKNKVCIEHPPARLLVRWMVWREWDQEAAEELREKLWVENLGVEVGRDFFG
jgi:hypothetical protein